MCCYNYVTDIQVLPVRIQPKTFRFPPNVHSTLRSVNREGFSRRSSTVGPGFITMKPKISRYAYRQGTHQGKLCSKNLDEAFCILKVTDVLIEKTLYVYLFENTTL